MQHRYGHRLQLGRPAHYRQALQEPLRSEAMIALLQEIEVKIGRSKRRGLMEIGYRGAALRRMMQAIRT